MPRSTSLAAGPSVCPLSARSPEDRCSDALDGLRRALRAGVLVHALGDRGGGVPEQLGDVEHVHVGVEPEGLIASVMSRNLSELWWLGVVVGIFEILLGFWASQSFIEPVLRLIILWAGFMAIFRGLGEIALAFGLRTLRKEIAVAS
jgi:hypothetical protein